jgi:alpha-L-rhamnosidase
MLSRLSIVFIPILSAFAQPAANSFDTAIFKAPPAAYRGHAMWSFPLTTLNEKYVVSGIEEMAKLNYGGFFIEAGGMRPGTTPAVPFLSAEYFRFYNLALEEAKKQGLEVILYDDYAFPTGTVGGQLATAFPQHLAKSLNLSEQDASGPSKIEVAVPKGIYIGAVMMNRDTHELSDVSDARRGDSVVFQIPSGNWKAMVFYLAEGRARVVDYLDEKAMDAFISMTYEKYQQNFGKYFGNLITQTFYDEPSMHHQDRMWTPGFNAEFQKKYGFSPMKYYPALWYDIGPATAAARNALFGFRGELYHRNFIKKLNDWCAAHHLRFGGHTDQEEPINPTPLTGDLMKVFEYQSVPIVDDIWWWGRSNVSYKIVTSSAFNWDKPVAAAETYAAYRILDEKIAYSVAMDQFAMGVNFQIPARTQQPKRAEVNEYVGRLSYMLQHGRHVADIAVLYPSASLLAAYHNAGGVQFPLPAGEQAPQITETAYAREGGPVYGMDYQNLGESLFRGLRVDYTYLHPDVLVNRATIASGKITLNNRENREEFSVLFLPAGDTISLAAATRIKEFYDQGGKVIATGLLPARAAEFGKDAEVRRIIYDVFGYLPDQPLRADLRRAQDRQNFYVFWYYTRKNAAGGQSMFIPNTHPWLVDFALRQVLPQRDVDIQQSIVTPKVGPDYDGALTYIHKVRDGRDIYFFANSTAKEVDTKVVLRGKKTLKTWNPHTGAVGQPPELADADGTTTLHLVLPSTSSLLFVQE